MRRSRDDMGWLLSRPGTKARLVYGLMKYGLSAPEIAAETGIKAPLVRVMMNHIRHPRRLSVKLESLDNGSRA